MFNWFAGSTFSVWWNFLVKNPILLFPKNWIHLILTSLFTIRNSVVSKKEMKKLHSINFSTIKLKDPIFIIGHWRSGTSHLHNILINDKNFNYPTLLQVTFPKTCLLIKENVDAKKVKNKRPMDNIEIQINSPGEEEVAVWTMCGISPIGSRLNRNKEKYYDRFLTFSEADKEEFNLWKKNFFYFLKKISINDQRRLILKSPENTARINILLELFPNAKFINIHRHPVNVFKSTKKLYDNVIRPSYYHKVSDEHLTNRIFKVYKKMYSIYFNEAGSIPRNNFVDISYEELVAEPMHTINKIYATLSLELNDDIETKIKKYLETVKNYKKNAYTEIDQKFKEKIYSEWQESFKYWNYD